MSQDPYTPPPAGATAWTGWERPTPDDLAEDAMIAEGGPATEADAAEPTLVDIPTPQPDAWPPAPTAPEPPAQPFPGAQTYNPYEQQPAPYGYQYGTPQAQTQYPQPGQPSASAPYAQPYPPPPHAQNSYAQNPYAQPPYGSPYPASYAPQWATADPWRGVPLTPDQRTWLPVAHLLPLISSWLGPLIMLVTVGDRDPRIGAHVKESLNFEISVAIALAASALLTIVLIGFVFIPVIALGSLVMRIVAAIAASRGELYRYPLTWRLLK